MNSDKLSFITALLGAFSGISLFITVDASCGTFVKAILAGITGIIFTLTIFFSIITGIKKAKEM